MPEHSSLHCKQLCLTFWLRLVSLHVLQFWCLGLDIWMGIVFSQALGMGRKQGLSKSLDFGYQVGLLGKVICLGQRKGHPNPSQGLQSWGIMGYHSHGYQGRGTWTCLFSLEMSFFLFVGVGKVQVKFLEGDVGRGRQQGGFWHVARLVAARTS